MTTPPSRRIVANFFISLDGVVEAPDKWHFPYFDDEMGAAVGEGFARTDAMLMGATNYREWAEYWPSSEDEIAATMNGATKYVVSDTLESADWSNTTLLRRAEAGDRLRELKAGQGKDIALSGSATLVRWLLSEGLLDELSLLVHPIVVGAGAHLFEEGTPRQPLTLASSATFGSGVVHLVYGPAAD